MSIIVLSHGIPTRVPVDATAVRVRAEHVHCIAVASRGAMDAAAPHVQWARDFWQAMHAWSIGRIYVNILGHDEKDRVRETYGAAYTRVQAVNATYDAANA